MTVDQYARENPGPVLYRGVWVEESNKNGQVERQRVYTRPYAVIGFAKGEITKRLNDKHRKAIVTETWVEVLGVQDVTQHRIIT